MSMNPVLGNLTINMSTKDDLKKIHKTKALTWNQLLIWNCIIIMHMKPKCTIIVETDTKVQDEIRTSSLLWNPWWEKFDYQKNSESVLRSCQGMILGAGKEKEEKTSRNLLLDKMPE